VKVVALSFPPVLVVMSVWIPLIPERESENVARRPVDQDVKPLRYKYLPCALPSSKSSLHFSMDLLTFLRLVTLRDRLELVARLPMYRSWCELVFVPPPLGSDLRSRVLCAVTVLLY
jgi:hypothetical protein